MLRAVHYAAVSSQLRPAGLTGKGGSRSRLERSCLVTSCSQREQQASWAAGGGLKRAASRIVPPSGTAGGANRYGTARTLRGMARLPTLEIVLVRHAQAVPVGTAPWAEHDDERPLTETGLRDADELALELDPFHLSAAYSSPYARSLQTVTPTAARRSLEVQQLDDLRERRLAATPRDDWADLLAKAWADPDFAAPGGESGREAQRRGMRALDLLRARHASGGRLLVGSHGNLISLILQALEPDVDDAFHLAMPMPAVFHLEHDGIGWRVLGGHGFAAVEGVS